MRISRKKIRMEFIIAFFIIGIVIAILLAYTSLSWGLVCYKFWYWFLIPVFPEVPSITYYQAVGLMFFIGLFRNHSSTQLKDEYKDNTSTLTSTLIGPWITLLVGLIVHSMIY